MADKEIETNANAGQETAEVESKAYNQSEVDQVVTKALKTHDEKKQAEFDEKIKTLQDKLDKATLSQDEIAKREQQRLEQEQASKFTGLKQENLELKIKAYLPSVGLPSESYGAYVDTSKTWETIKGVIDGQAQVLKDALEKKAQENAANNAPHNFANSGNSTAVQSGTDWLKSRI